MRDSRSFRPTPALEIIDDRIGPDQHFAEHRGEQHLEGPSLNAQSAPIAGGAGRSEPFAPSTSPKGELRDSSRPDISRELE
jgi:hypothetical protein